jgi:hypothetical protein
MYLQLSSYKKRKRMEKHAYEEWKSTVIASNDQNKAKGFKRIPFSVFTSHINQVGQPY